MANAMIHIQKLKESTAGLTEDRNAARMNIAESDAQVNALQKEFQATKDPNASLIKTGTAEVSDRAAKARTKAPVVYPTPELDTFRAKELEWISRKAKSETMCATTVRSTR